MLGIASVIIFVATVCLAYSNGPWEVDIDSYDCSVLQELLEVVDARMVLVEVNPSVPPPYRWAMLYHPELWTFFFKQPSLQEL
eukprot:1505950-Amphidinium_carterae.1